MDGNTATKLADLAAKTGTTPQVLWDSMVSHARWDAVAFASFGIVMGAFGFVGLIAGMLMLRRQEKFGDGGWVPVIIGVIFILVGPLGASFWLADIAAPEAQAVKNVAELVK